MTKFISFSFQLCQIPAMYAMEWRLENYKQFDLSSLKVVIFGGQSVTSTFIEKISQMAPFVATGEITFFPPLFLNFN